MLSLLSFFTVKALNKYVLMAVVLILTLLAGIRDGTGTDFYTYLGLWDAATSIFDGLDYGYKYFEPGFRVLVSILKIFSNSQLLFYTFFAAVPLVFLYKALVKYRINYYVGIFIYVNVFYLAYVFNGMGQAIIISVFLYYFDDFLNLKTIRIFIISIFFVFIHKSAVLILIAYIMYYLCIRLKNEILLLVGCILGIISYKIHLVAMILNLISPELAYTYTQVFSETTSVFQLITRTMILMILYWFGKQLNGDVFYRNCLKIYIIGYILYIVFYDYNALATRVNMLYRSVEILMFSYAILHTKNLFTRISIFLVIALIYGYSFFKVIYLDDFYYHSVLW